ncbi:ac13 [Lambdina fiscellaria nucleopolyhedrovirus]|uniref:Ac13 n=1 Tax=Lambdina fiscellaria nucleopolyhedrovirus TaxID=1642929 RepID=A0A0E3Z6N7_9ABAC|nr:ac13 [Lambdina fiscellaria nucleopolyhedrovirus]AKC91631.1 ac13 [Lambdina fiscellaria nucleopolyhedrovirus]
MFSNVLNKLLAMFLPPSEEQNEQADSQQRERRREEQKPWRSQRIISVKIDKNAVAFQRLLFVFRQGESGIRYAFDANDTMWLSMCDFTSSALCQNVEDVDELLRYARVDCINFKCLTTVLYGLHLLPHQKQITMAKRTDIEKIVQVLEKTNSDFEHLHAHLSEQLNAIEEIALYKQRADMANQHLERSFKMEQNETLFNQRELDQYIEQTLERKLENVIKQSLTRFNKATLEQMRVVVNEAVDNVNNRERRNCWFENDNANNDNDNDNDDDNNNTMANNFADRVAGNLCKRFVGMLSTASANGDNDEINKLCDRLCDKIQKSLQKSTPEADDDRNNGSGNGASIVFSIDNSANKNSSFNSWRRRRLRHTRRFNINNEVNEMRYDTVKYPKDATKHPRLAVFVKSKNTPALSYDNEHDKATLGNVATTDVAFLTGQNQHLKSNKRKYEAADMELVYDAVHPNPLMAVLCFNEELELKNFKFSKKSKRFYNVECDVETMKSFINEII